MTTDPYGAAAERIEATSQRPSSPDGTESVRDLSDLALAIERVTASIVDAAPTAEGFDTLERLADIAFVLHERDVEASLCDALDAAIRALGSAEASRQARAERAQQAAASLRVLVRRAHDMIGFASAQQRLSAAANAAEPMKFIPATELPVSESLDGAIAGDGLFAVDAEEEAFAQAVASLAGSLPSPGKREEGTSDPRRQSADIGVTRFDPQALPNPDEDPGDLFEPAQSDAADRNRRAASAAPPSSAPAARQGAPPRDAQSSPPAAPLSPILAAAEPPPHSVPQDDPLAPLRGLSEEELIALFS